MSSVPARAAAGLVGNRSGDAKLPANHDGVCTWQKRWVTSASGSRSRAWRAAEVTTRLGITPTYSHEVGDAFGHSGQRRSHAMWSVSTKADGPGPLGDHLTRQLDLVEPKRSIVIDLANEGCTMDWFCFLSVEGGRVGSC